jgi:thiamine transport system permease protein
MLGLGYIVAWGPLGLLGSPLLIPVAHALLAFPFVVRTLAPALRDLNRRLREAARMLGARPLRVLLAVDMPLLSPALASAAIFAFTASLGEFGTALLLARPDYPTAPMTIARLLGQPGATNYGQALALSTILMLTSVVGFLLIERLRPEGVGEL